MLHPVSVDTLSVATQLYKHEALLLQRAAQCILQRCQPSRFHREAPVFTPEIRHPISAVNLPFFYARQHICYSAYMPWQFRLSVRPFVSPSVTWVDQSKTVEAIIIIIARLTPNPYFMILRLQQLHGTE